MPTFVGQVNIDIYFGTKFNMVNVPYSTEQIKSDATRHLQRTGQVVWQTTWLSDIRINIDNYQDIVGAQYVLITDTGAPSHGGHWYTVVGYQQLSRGTVDIGIAYDPLLSIGINNIKEISGVMKRWTVDNDTPFTYTLSPEPINQIDDYRFTYETLTPVTNFESVINVVGCPVDLTTAPEILQYENADGTQTTIYYPKMVRSTATQMSTVIGGSHTFDDGLGYFLWNANEVRENFDKAVGLAYDLQTVAYKLPVSDILSVTFDGSKVTAMRGTSKLVSKSAVGGVGLRSTGYNNSKAGELGTFFTLYNTITGDAVTISNYDLANLNIRIFADPSFNGRFFARFEGYMDDNSTTAGMVKSAGWQPLTVSSTTGYGSVLSQVNNAMAMRQVQTVQDVGIETANANFYAGSAALAGQTVDRALNTQVNYQNRWDMSNALGRATAEKNAFTQGLGIIANAAGRETALAIQWGAQLDAVNKTTETQKAMLAVQGTLGRNTPPATKYAGTEIYSADAYKFSIRATTLSSNDRLRADRFFTAYGYNVDNMILNSPTQLKCRQRFTFIQADDVFIGAAQPIDYTRTHDLATQEYIKNRFSSGLRIWTQTPDYNWANSNPIGA